MAQFIKMLSIDPGFSNVGVAMIHVFRDRAEVARVGHLGSTKQNKKGQLVHVCVDNTRRVRTLAERIVPMCLMHDEKNIVKAGIEILAYESYSPVRSSSTSHKLGLSYGMLVTIAQMLSISIVEVPTQDIKAALCGKRNADKGDVEQATIDQIEWSEVAQMDLDKTAPNKRVHIYDAVAVAIAAMHDSEIVKVARAMLDVDPVALALQKADDLHA